MIFWIISSMICIYLLIESIRFNKMRSRIPIRIHVYGTRGKTSTTTYIYNVLKDANWKVMAKTTGDTPQLLFPNGEKKTLKRLGPARIHEYISCLYKAAHNQCDAVVFECMALSPESIVMARKILSPTHIVITNTRPDHHESMGRTPEEIIQTLALSIGDSATVVALEDEGGAYLKKETLRKNGFFYGIPYDKNQPPLIQTQQIVSKVAQLWVIEGPALSIMTWPSFNHYHLESIGTFAFLDLFSTNDTLSSELLLDKALEQLKQTSTINKPIIALLATRPDRPLRTKVFIDWFASDSKFSHHIIVGWHRFYAHHVMRKHSLKRINNTLNPMPAPFALLSSIKTAVGEDFILVGLGNAHGYGEQFRRFLVLEKEKSACC